VADAYVEFEDETWTLEEYETFMRGTGEWPSENTEPAGKVITLPSGCYLIPEQYTRPDEHGAVV